MESCLVVSTATEVLVCALVRIDVAPESKRYMENGDGGSLKLVPTKFSLGTDGVRILAVAGTENGRIFLGGDDGSLYEMTLDLGIPEKKLTIEEKLDLFYDQGENIPTVVTADDEADSVPAVAVKLGKRILQSLESGYSPPRKCQKINRSSQVSAAVKAVVPEFIINTTSFIFGRQSASSGGRISQIVVDEVRQTLYTLSVEGWICSYDLSGLHDARLAAAMDCSRTVRLYLEAVARGQMFPPSTSHSSSSLGSIAFPGGGTAAQAGVGGMDGARSILKLAEHRHTIAAGSRNRDTFTSDNVLKPISIQMVAPTESSRLTLIAITEGGLRLYLSSLAPSVIGSGANAGARIYGARQRNPFLPFHRITLCHVRAPPTIILDNQDFSSMSTQVEGGIVPRMYGSRMNRVDACLYKQGIFFAAFTGVSQRNGAKRNDSTNSNEQRPGDIIVAACSDEIVRKMENGAPVSSGVAANTDKTKQESRLDVKGGLAETISLPMASAYGGSSPNLQATLPGGIVWGVAEMSSKDDALFSMTVNSQTPTESELSVGLPPAYVPPNKEREGLPAKESNGISSAFEGPRRTKSSALVSKELPVDQVKVLGNVLTNFLLSRPLRQGLPLIQDQGYGHHVNGMQPCYRISKSECYRGFSSSAGETASGMVTSPAARSKATGSTLSARLRPWLLRPATVPLNPLSSQLYTETKEIVALNAGGLHFFGKKTLLSSLAEALVDTSDNVQNDSYTTSFFAGYTFKEGCFMCLALAVGCGPVIGNATFNEQLRSRALDAALARAFVPKLVSRVGTTDPAIHPGINGTVDPLAPQGYTFHASALSDGLHSLFSRLVRPIWHKPAVVVTEGRTVKLRHFNKAKVTPAKVEILLNETTIDQIRHLLSNLMNLMKKTFSRAIKSVPGASQKQGNSMEVDENEDDQYLTTALLYRSHVQGGSVDSSQLTPLEAEHVARLIEEKNIHSLYRLLARVVQLLNLMSLLRRADGMTELKEVDWGLLHGLTIAQLVQTAEGQERLESLLNSLVTTSASNRSYTAVKSAQADHLSSCFAEQCYLFFSPGSRFAYLGLRKADEALRQPIASSSRVSLANQAAQHFCQAAQHWYSAPLITGRILHTQGKESFHQIAHRAMQFESPLAKAVEALVELEDVASAVEICLITASNFKTDTVMTVRPYLQFGVQQKYELGWEQNLYHIRRETQRNTENLVAAVSGSPSASQIIAYGTEVTSKDAVDTCYALIFHHLSELITSQSVLADNMVSACAAASDISFLKAFFSFLLESNHADTLLRIDSPALERWLRERRDPDLLWRYFSVQKRNEEAGQVALDRANETILKFPLGERIEWLSRSVNSFNCALKEGPDGMFTINSNESISQKAKEVSDALHVARLQSRILGALDSSRLDDFTPELREKLSTTLLPISDLYNDYAAAFSLFEECLLILHACRQDHVQMIQTLWKNVFCEEILPCATRKESIYSFLQEFVAELELGDQVIFLSNGEPSSSIMIFEDATWEKSLFNRTVALGKLLYGNGADYVFPKNFILRTLEGMLNISDHDKSFRDENLNFCVPGLRQQVSNQLSPGWALLVLADVGISFLEIIDAYESVSNHDYVLLGGVHSEIEIERIAAFLEIINYWLALADSNVRSTESREYVAYQQLSRAKASGRLYSKLDAIKAKIGDLPAATSMLEQLEAIEEKL